MTWTFRLLVLAAVGALAACVFDATVPPDAQIQCDNEGDCPDGMRCASGLGACVKEDSDSEAPALVGDPRLAPRAATIGTVLAVAIEATEDLKEPPVVTLRSPSGDERAMALAAAGARGGSFSFTVSAAEAPGLWTAECRLVDAAGNVSTPSVGDVVIDTTPPVVVETAGDSLVNAASDDVTIEVELDEPVQASPSVRSSRNGVDDAVLWEPSAMSERRWQFRVSDASALADGPHALRLSARDEAGNALDTALALVLDVDRTPPFPVAEIVGGAGQVFAPTDGHDLVEIDVDANEPGASVLFADAPCPSTGGNRALCSYQVTGAEGDAATLTIDVLDAAMNLRSVDITIAIDAVGPAVIDETVIPTLVPASDNPRAAVSRMTVGTTLEVVFQTTDALTPTVTLGGVAMTVDTGFGVSHVARLVLAAGALPDGEAELRVSGADALGNPSDVALVPRIVIDTTPPDALDDARNDGLRYTRDGPTGTVTTSAGVLEDEGALLVAAHAAPLTLGVVEADAAGAAAPIAFALAGHTTVDAIQLDGAGNASPPAQIRNVDVVLRAAAAAPRLNVGHTNALLDDAPIHAYDNSVAPLYPIGGASYFVRHDQRTPAGVVALRTDAIGGGLVALHAQGTSALEDGEWRPRAMAADASGVQLGGFEDDFASVSPPQSELYANACANNGGQGLSLFEVERSFDLTSGWQLAKGAQRQALPPEGKHVGMTYVLDADGELVVVGGARHRRLGWFEYVTCAIQVECDLDIYQASLDTEVNLAPPVPRSQPGAVLDGARGVIVVFGGESTSDTVCGVGGTNPSSCYLDVYGLGGVYDLDYGFEYCYSLESFAWVTSLPLGPLGDTWERDAAGVWRNVTPTDPEGDGDPAPTATPWMAWDPDSGLTLLSEASTGDLWGWNGASWRRLDTTDTDGDGEPAALGPTAVDEEQGALFMLSDTVWRFAGGSWTRVGPLPASAPRPGTDLAFIAVDPAVTGVALFAFDRADGSLWAREPEGWRALPVTDVEGDGAPSGSAAVAPFSSPTDATVSVVAADANGIWLFAGDRWVLSVAGPIEMRRFVADAGDGLIATFDGGASIELFLDGAFYGSAYLPVDSGCDAWGWCDAAAVTDVDRLADGRIAVTSQTYAGVQVQTSTGWPPSFDSYVTVAGTRTLGAYCYDYGYGCTSDMDTMFGSCWDFGYGCYSDPLTLCGEVSVIAPDVVAGGADVLLFGGAETSFQHSTVSDQGLAEYGDVTDCLVPWADGSDVRTLGASPGVTQNPALPRGDPLFVGAPVPLPGSGVGRGDAPLFVEALDRIWSFQDGVGDRPATLLSFAPDAFGLPADALGAVELSLRGTAPGGLTLHAWDGRAWIEQATGTDAIDVNYADASALQSVWFDPRHRVRFAVAPGSVSGVGAFATLDVDDAFATLHFLLP